MVVVAVVVAVVVVVVAEKGEVSTESHWTAWRRYIGQGGRTAYKEGGGGGQYPWVIPSPLTRHAVMTPRAKMANVSKSDSKAYPAKNPINYEMVNRRLFPSDGM